MKIFMLIVGIVITIGGLVLLLATPVGLVFIAAGIIFILISRKIAKAKKEKANLNMDTSTDMDIVVDTSNEVESFLVAGFDHYQNELQELLTCENDDYTLSAKDFKEDVFERCYQYETEYHNAKIVPEPENEYDPNALAVYVDDMKIGYVGRKDQKKVNSIDAVNIEVEVFGGKYKEVVEDGYDEKIVSGSTPYKAMLHLYYKPDEQAE